MGGLFGVPFTIRVVPWWRVKSVGLEGTHLVTIVPPGTHYHYTPPVSNSRLLSHCKEGRVWVRHEGEEEGASQNFLDGKHENAVVRECIEMCSSSFSSS